MTTKFVKMDGMNMTKESILNCPENIESLTSDELLSIKELKVNESIQVGFLEIIGIEKI